MPRYAQKYTALGENGGAISIADDDFRQVGKSIRNSNWPDLSPFL